jgi:cell division protein FtsL
MQHRIQINDLVRDATPSENELIAERDAADAEYLQQLQQMAAAKQSALAKLKALGLTDAEISALVG